ncbi:hypothetical protein LEP1GSC060_3729 [Leptospira weilii serovar Ranarum str. ICFT]|uniref:Uncharacterized protein n=1 Tax=Leptospira weilii serovar Ranarum str. ICFT TaxID=1218598 RepID=N1WFN2_9LEPT|nr:hypothetical protein LEP1GSC060_3729 [Leptospira weilii serovar Ranarum str. ICFT]
MRNKLQENFRRHLPPHAEFILKPAAHMFFSAVCKKGVPVIIDLFLRFYADHKGDAPAELKLRSAIVGKKLLAVQNEIRLH